MKERVCLFICEVSLFAVFMFLMAISAPDAVAAVRDVTAYGATANDTTNDRAAINAAIADLQPGDELYFPCGTYKVSAALSPIAVRNVTIAGSPGCVTIKGVNSGYTLMQVGKGGPSQYTPLIATAPELSTTFSANFANIGGLSAGNYVVMSEGGRDFSTDSSGVDTACDISGCRGEVLFIQNVNGLTATVATALHNLYDPFVNKASVARINNPVDNVTVRDITFDGSGTVALGLYLVAATNSTVSNVTAQNFTDMGLHSYYSYNLAWNNIAVTHVSKSAFNLKMQGRPSVNGATVSNLNAGSFGYNLSSLAEGTFSNMTVDAAGTGTGRPFKPLAASYNTFKNLLVKNSEGKYNGISIEYYSSHNTFDSCTVINSIGNGIVGFGNYNQYNTFNNCTLSGNTIYQMWQGQSALKQNNDHSWTVNGGSYTGQPGQRAIALVSNNAYVHDVKFYGPATVGLSISGNNACVNNNTFTGFSVNLDIYASGTGNKFNNNTTPDGTTPGSLPAGACGTTSVGQEERDELINLSPFPPMRQNSSIVLTGNNLLRNGMDVYSIEGKLVDMRKIQKNGIYLVKEKGNSKFIKMVVIK